MSTPKVPETRPVGAWSRSVRARPTGRFAVEVIVRDGRFTLTSDEPPDEGGDDTGPMPSELLFSSVASCFAMAVMWVARKRRQDVDDLEIAVYGASDRAQRRYAQLQIVAMSALATADPKEFEAILRIARDVCWVTRSIGPGMAVTVRAEGSGEVDGP